MSVWIGEEAQKMLYDSESAGYDDRRGNVLLVSDRHSRRGDGRPLVDDNHSRCRGRFCLGYCVTTYRFPVRIDRE